MTFAGEGTPAEEEFGSETMARCTSVSFSSPDGSVRTGYSMVARLGYRAARTIPGAVFRISIYWPSGYLCAQLSTELSLEGYCLEPGAGVVEFQCAVLPVVPGLYRVDLAIEANGHEINLRERCATLRVEPGKIVSGDFYIESTWKVLPEASPLVAGSVDQA
jgi:hypothetical protein